jgi:hypothetical protein
MEQITPHNILQHLCTACGTGSTRLGFEPHEIGIHSLRLGAAMELYIREISIYTIMLTGRWSSNAFLCYIKKQVNNSYVANMILTFWSFNHIPDIAPKWISGDPYQRNHCDNAEMRRNIGRNKSQRVQLLAFSLYA